MRQDPHQLEPPREALREVDVESAAGPAAHDVVGRLLRRQQRRHLEPIGRREQGLDEARVDHRHADAQRLQVQVQDLGEVLQRRLRGPIGDRVRQAAVARHAGHETEVPVTLGDQRGQRCAEQMQCADVVDLQVPQRVIQIELGGPHRPVVAGAVHRHVEPTAQRQHLRHGGRDGGPIADVERERVAAGVGCNELVERLGIARRHHDHRARRMQPGGGRAADAGRRADDPHDALAPVFDHGIQRHGIRGG